MHGLPPPPPKRRECGRQRGRRGESQLWWRCWQGPLRRANTGVSLSLPRSGLTCLDIKSPPSALNTLGPSVSPAPYWIG